MRVILTYELTWAAGTDAANANMRKASRTLWNEEDYNIAVNTMHQLWLWPEEERTWKRDTSK